jgi:hypothetical protein
LVFVSIACLLFSTQLYSQNLPTAKSSLFSGSGNCAVCHSAGSGAFITKAGKDISPVGLWQASMMANSSKDPLWQAKVTAEVAEHPALQEIIEDKCTTCHMPMGKTEALHNGAAHFPVATGFTDALSMDGVSCTLCHQVQSQNLGTKESFSGGYQIAAVHDIFGPYLSPTSAPMQNQSGYLPKYAAHINDSELCATCHTLYTPYVDNQGAVAGYFPEQTPYLEWQNSRYPAESKECQSCHMPTTEEAMKIATQPPWISANRAPIWEHSFSGSNVFMNSMLKTYAGELGVTAAAARLDESISSNRLMVQEKTIQLQAQASIILDTLTVNVTVANLAGHKFPTGFPSRRAWIHLQVRNSLGELIYESGSWDASGEIIDIDKECEPHHQMITSAGQVQIYEAIMQDVDNKVTYTLLRGASYRKDNRLPPAGFKSKADHYADIAIVGEAAVDADFNRDASGTEGSGSDRVLYKIPVTNSGASFTVLAEMVFQTITPRFAVDLTEHQTDKVARFKNYYAAADKAPIPLQRVTLSILQTDVAASSDTRPKSFDLLPNYPNPFNATTQIRFTLPERGLTTLEIYNMLGQKIRTLASEEYVAGEYQLSWEGTDDLQQPVPSGIYIAVLRSQGMRKTCRLALIK